MNNLKNSIILFLILSASISIQGCFYFPQRVPNIKGIVVKDGKAVSEATVNFISFKCQEDQDKGKAKSECKTNHNGSFEILGKKGLGIIIPFPADYIVCWKLCFTESDGTITCWDVESFGPPDPPEFIEIECDLNSKNVLYCLIIF